MTALRPKLIYLVTEDWYFWSHRLPMARAAQAAGFDVGVATRVDEHGARIRAEGFTLYPLALASPRHRTVGELARRRRGLSPLCRRAPAPRPSCGAEAGGARQRRGAARRVPAVVNAVTGVGFVASSPTLRARLLRRPMDFALAHLLERANSRVIVQNEDDRALLLALNAGAAERITVIRARASTPTYFQAAPEPPSPPVIAGYAGRLLADKGIAALVEAQQSLQRRGNDLRLMLAGTPDAENASSIDAATLAAWRNLPGITWLGEVEDIRTLWSQAHIAVLASRREGLPKSLLEAAAMGRPLVATDVPGCREIARDGVNALLVPADDAPALAAALERLAGDAALRQRFGAASRALVESELAADAVGAATVACYRDLLRALRLPVP